MSERNEGAPGAAKHSERGQEPELATATEEGVPAKPGPQGRERGGMTTTEFETLRFKVKEGVAWLRLNRPDRLNAFTPEMWGEMRALGRALLADPGDIRVLVVSGEGRAFSSGIDT